MDHKSHWEHVYRKHGPAGVSWYQLHADRSLDLIGRIHGPTGGAIIDVGGGASVLVDGLLDSGYRDITVLDLSQTALATAQARLGQRGAVVRWIEADILNAQLPASAYTVWHDRAVFHFLTSRDQRARYVDQVRRAVKVGGVVLVATFADDGPTRCSGLEVNRYSPDALYAEFGAGFDLLTSEREDHVTPGGAHQSFIYCLCRIAREP